MSIDKNDCGEIDRSIDSQTKYKAIGAIEPMQDIRKRSKIKLRINEGIKRASAHCDHS
jgi:hypothetical protein